MTPISLVLSGETAGIVQVTLKNSTALLLWVAVFLSSLGAHPPPEEADGVLRVDGRGFAAVWRGLADPLLFTTTTGGTNWSTYAIPHTLSGKEYPILLLAFTSAGIVIGDGRSLDTFELKESGVGRRLATRPPASDLAVSGSHVVASIGMNDRKEVSFSHDGGLTWPFKVQRPSDWKLLSIFFVSEQHGFLYGVYQSSGKMEFAQTTDLGRTWVFLDAPTYEANRMFFADARTGWLLSHRDYGLMVTKDGGESWQGPVEPNRLFADAFLLNPLVGLVLDPQTQGLVTTSDGGMHWRETTDGAREMLKRLEQNHAASWLDEFRFRLSVFVRN